MTDTPPGVSAQAPASDAAQTQGGAQAIDIKKLADKVYHLLLADARLGRARGDSPLVGRRDGEG